MSGPVFKWIAAFIIGGCVIGCETIPRHSERTIIGWANAAALKTGYSLSDYEMHAVYRPLREGHQWFVYYYGGDNPDGTFKGFIVAIDDRTDEVRLMR